MSTNKSERGRRSDLHWNRERVEQVDRKLARGVPVKDVAKEEGVSRQRLDQIMKENDILPPNKR